MVDRAIRKNQSERGDEGVTMSKVARCQHLHTLRLCGSTASRLKRDNQKSTQIPDRDTLSAASKSCQATRSHGKVSD